MTEHLPTKVLETKQVIVYDDFLAPEIAEKVWLDMTRADYSYINTTKIGRAWRIRDGFPLRARTVFRYAEGVDVPDESWAYPSKTDLDLFVDAVYRVTPEVTSLIGTEGEQWKTFSATHWLYPQGTGLSLHSDGGDKYSGAYTFFMSKEWNLHWGGLLLVTDPATDVLMNQYHQHRGPHEFWAERWLMDDMESKIVSAVGFGQFIYPRFNRMVFIKNDAQHMVTQVTPSAGDRTRMSIAGFFHRTAKVS